MQSQCRHFGRHLGGALLALGVAFVSVQATAQTMKLVCKYDSAKLSDTATEKGYTIDCRNITDDRCPTQHYVLDANWKTQGDDAVLMQTAVSGLGEKSTQTTTVNRKTMRFAFRWEMASKEKPPPVLTGEGSCAPEK